MSMALQEEVKIRGNVDDEKGGSSGLFLNPIAMQWLFLFALVAWALVNIVSYTNQTSAYKDRQTDATLSDVVSSFGLEPGKEYPVVIGDRTTVDSGQASYGGGAFYVKGEGEWASSTSILVSFEGNNGSYVLEIPVSRVTFDVRQNIEEASMSVYVPGTEQPEEVAYWLHSYACSKDTWAYGWVQKNCSPNPPQLVISDDVRSQGLATVLNGAFNKESAGATIVLSPSMYNNILGIK